jgi:hypothetical protein
VRPMQPAADQPAGPAKPQICGLGQQAAKKSGGPPGL